MTVLAHRLPLCPVTRKLSFASETLAALWLAVTQARRDSGERPGYRREARVYRCGHCGHWHMTSQVTPPEGRDR